nr:AraC family transcriptional regulator [Eubacterium sp.]
MDQNQHEWYHETKKHTPDDFPYNTYLCSIPLDFQSVKTHWHDEVEFIVIKKGEGIVSVDLTPYTVKAGDIILVFSGQLHSIEQKDSATMEYENILFRPSLLRSLGQDFCNDAFLQPLLSGKRNLFPVIVDTCQFHRELSVLFHRIDELCDARPHGYQLAIKGYLFQIMYVLFSASGNTCSDRSAYVSQKSLEKLKRILSYVADHYQHPITIEEIAGYCFYSKSYFMKFFKQTMGMGFIQYVNDYRLEIAAKELLQTSDNILEIAVRTGFDNLSYFNRCFKKKYGVTPGTYRNPPATM